MIVLAGFTGLRHHDLMDLIAEELQRDTDELRDRFAHREEIRRGAVEEILADIDYPYSDDPASAAHSGCDRPGCTGHTLCGATSTGERLPLKTARCTACHRRYLQNGWAQHLRDVHQSLTGGLMQFYRASS